MNYKKDFKVNVERATTAVGQKGFGTILIVSTEADKETKVYTQMDEITRDYNADGETQAIARVLFGQGVDKVMITGVSIGTGEDLDVSLITARLDELVGADKDFFGVVCTLRTAEVRTEISEWADGQKKIYAVTSDIQPVIGSGKNTLIGYHPTDYLAEKALGYMLTREIGSVDLDGKPIPSITSSGVTADEYDTLMDANVNVCVERFGAPVIAGGNMADGERMDILLSEYWIKFRMEEDLAQLKTVTPKIPYTDAGVALLIDVANTRLKIAAQRGIIAVDEDGVAEYTVEYIPVSEVPESERAERVYNYVKWTARLAGSIRGGTIYGELTV